MDTGGAATLSVGMLNRASHPRPILIRAGAPGHGLPERHHLVVSNGAWTESFQPGDRTLGAMGKAQPAEILELFPGLATPAGTAACAAARPVLTPAAAALSAPE